MINKILSNMFSELQEDVYSVRTVTYKWTFCEDDIPKVALNFIDVINYTLQEDRTTVVAVALTDESNWSADLKTMVNKFTS